MTPKRMVQEKHKHFSLTSCLEKHQTSPFLVKLLYNISPTQISLKERDFPYSTTIWGPRSCEMSRANLTRPFHLKIPQVFFGHLLCLKLGCFIGHIAPCCSSKGVITSWEKSRGHYILPTQTLHYC